MSIKNFRFQQFFSKKLLTFAEVGYIIQLPIAEVGNKYKEVLYYEKFACRNG
uniref:Uncharacterized protein n=1 Tax=Siphoviridae sp. ctLKT1 TaxID=2825451 RepID=A0A8S5U7T3_9CAUD|nr:MAG TPA: hypothetical protein [Siphoviridae sp. ctLKT1]